MRRVLVASRGTTAVRTIDACRQRDLSPFAVAAVCEQRPPHVAGADGCVQLDGRTLSETYDCADSIVSAASRCQADLVHPGCGALAENPALPRLLAVRGIGVVGSQAAALASANDKGLTVAAAKCLGIPVLPHTTTRAGLDALVAEVGLPLVVKPANGCLGRGVRVVREPEDLEQALAGYARAGTWYAERYLERGRLVAITVAVDAAGVCLELGERETLLLAGGFKLA